jgi:hypothetical protein
MKNNTIKKINIFNSYGMPKIKITETFNERSERIILNSIKTIEHRCIVTRNPGYGNQEEDTTNT